MLDLFFIRRLTVPASLPGSNHFIFGHHAAGINPFKTILLTQPALNPHNRLPAIRFPHVPFVTEGEKRTGL
ncbi:MAG: hypothetical protein CM15mP95_2400 [Alphaproteobacteria bacterium]|nr:MAG: hypothetical protein CM15mP95_2400 [Alphaproteobacteria bacterium]